MAHIVLYTLSGLIPCVKLSIFMIIKYKTCARNDNMLIYLYIYINELNHLSWNLSRSLPNTNRSRSTWCPQAWATTFVWPLPCFDEHRRHLVTSMLPGYMCLYMCLVSTDSLRRLPLYSPEAGPLLLPLHQIALFRNKLVAHVTMVLHSKLWYLITHTCGIWSFFNSNHAADFLVTYCSFRKIPLLYDTLAAK